MKTLANNNSNNESVNATRRAASKNNADVDALRKLATEMIGTTLQWPNGQQYRLASFEKVTKNKVTFWLSEPPCHHGVSVMDISRTMLEHLQATGEHRTDCGTTVTVNREEEKPLAYIAYCRGIAQDIFTDWGKAVADLSRHVYNTLQDCCGGKVSKESESRYQVYFKKGNEWEVCEVVPVDLNRPQDREAYKAQHERLGLPTLEQAWEITLKAEEQWRPATAKDYREGNKFEDEIKIGDRVYSCNYETMGTVVGRYWWNGDNCYRVRMDRECEGGFGRKFIVTSFHRDGITKNIGNDGREIIGNAEYYRETLFACWWGFNGEPRTFSFNGQQIDIYEKDGQEWEVVSHHQNGEPTRDTMTTGEVCEWLARLYSKNQEPTLETASEIKRFGKMFIYRLYIKWKWMQQRFERIGDMDRAADCFYHRLRLTKLYIYQPGWRIMDYADMKPIFFPRQRIK